MVLSLANGNAALAGAQGVTQSVPEIAALEPELEGLYRDLHEHPELAFHEERTAAALAERLRALGFEVTTGVAHTGLVAILRNGSGPVVMLRTELDALPIEEKTGLPFASKSKGLILKARSAGFARMRPRLAHDRLVRCRQNYGATPQHLAWHLDADWPACRGSLSWSRRHVGRRSIHSVPETRFRHFDA